jgi:hypothetical protein
MDNKSEFNDVTDFRYGFWNGFVSNRSAEDVYLVPSDPDLIFDHSATKADDHYHLVMEMSQDDEVTVLEKEYKEFPAGQKIYLALSLKGVGGFPIFVAVNLSENQVFRQEIRLKSEWQKYIFAFSSPGDFDKGKVQLTFESRQGNRMAVNVDDIALYL